MSNKIPIEVYRRAVELLRYTPYGGRFVNRIDRSGRNVKGDPAGRKLDHKEVTYGITIGIKQFSVKGSKLSWFVHHGCVPDDRIRRRDGDVHNDCIENLYLKNSN